MLPFNETSELLFIGNSDVNNVLVIAFGWHSISCCNTALDENSLRDNCETLLLFSAEIFADKVFTWGISLAWVIILLFTLFLLFVKLFRLRYRELQLLNELYILWDSLL